MTSIRAFVQSLRFKLFVGIAIIVIPLVSILILNNVYAIDVVRNQVAQSNQNLLAMYMQQMDRNLEEADKYLANLSQQNTDLLQLEKEEQSDPFQYTKAVLRLNNQINADIGFYRTMDIFFIYSAMNDELIMTPSLAESYEERESEKSHILTVIKAARPSTDNTRWHVYTAGENHYLYRIVRVGNEYIGAWVDARKMMVPLNYIELGNTGAALLVTKDWQPMSHEDFVKNENVQLKAVDALYYLTGARNQYLAMSEGSVRGEFRLVVLIPDQTILERLPAFRWIIGIISVVACAFLAAFLYFMRKEFLSPINRIIFAMRRLKDGNWNPITEPTSASSEFQIMNQSFNDMMQEIQDLKIHVYEEKLHLQKAELKHLQLQVNPHFFLNSLNMIYNLAMTKDYSVIQDLSKCLVNYFRFMFRSNADFVKLSDELTHTRNYLRIQQLRFPEGLSFRVEAADELSDCSVPPLVIQSLVENVIKHAVTLDQRIEIAVQVKASGSEDTMEITIADTGKGFPEEILKNLQEGSHSGREDEQIGIWNLTCRLSLLYENESLVQFSNRPSGGAFVLIRLPIRFMNKGA